MAENETGASSAQAGEDSKFSIGRVLQIGGAVVGTLVGSGFASGQEVMQYFTAYGIPGIWGALLTTVLFAFMCGAVTYYGYKFAHSEHFSAFRHYCGKYFGFFMDVFAVIFCFLVGIVMTSGSGAMFEQYFGIPATVGSTVMAVIALASALLGLNKMTKLLGSTAPICILFLVVVSLAAAALNWGNLANADAMVAEADASGNVLRAVDFNAPMVVLVIVSSLNYVAHNIVAGVPFISKVGTRSHNMKEALWGGVLGGILLGLCAIALNFGMLTTYDKVYALEVPGLEFAHMLNPVLGGVYAVILIIMIYNTIVPMMVSVANLFITEEKDLVKHRIILVALAVIFLVGGQFQFSMLINIIYPFVGYVGMIFMVVVAVQLIRWKLFGSKEPQE